MEIKDGFVEFIIVIMVILITVTLVRNVTENSNNWTIPGTTCDEDDHCIGLIFECITHVDDNYVWDANIKCLNNKCVCMSD